MRALATCYFCKLTRVCERIVYKGKTVPICEICEREAER